MSGGIMHKQIRTCYRFVAFLLILCSFSLTSCAFVSHHSGIQAWLDSPLDGIEVALGTWISLEAHVTTEDVLSSIQFTINGELLIEFPDPALVNNLVHVSEPWLADEPGEFMIQVITIGSNPGVNSMDQALIRVVAPVIPLTPSPTASATTPPPIDITVTPIPPTITPTPDTTGPPAPTPVYPPLPDCTGSKTLDWLPVTDPSGIAEYQVEAERRPDTISSWTVAAGSPWIGISSTDLSIPVECGFYYRWRVRAVDGVGNPGAFSGWAYFEVSLP
jgi:hypothetical protein